MQGSEGIWALGEQMGRWDGEEAHAELSRKLAVGVRGREGQRHSFEAAHRQVLP